MIEEHSLNIIAENTEIEGKLTIDSVTRFHGKFKGEIHAKNSSMLILAATSVVEGKVFADKIIIDGFVRGEVIAQTKITVTSQGRVSGKIQAPQVEVEIGAWIDGSFISSPKPLATSVS
ncbi:MAG: polymer-forming cytoskeletal protein [Xanthomonadaceae bacterium]|nr:polymer-forming cytoskeletal protein [Xanthomonadaceae bacterium]